MIGERWKVKERKESKVTARFWLRKQRPVLPFLKVREVGGA